MVVGVLVLTPIWGRFFGIIPLFKRVSCARIFYLIFREGVHCLLEQIFEPKRKPKMSIFREPTIPLLDAGTLSQIGMR